MVFDITPGLEVGANGPLGENVQELVEQVYLLLNKLIFKNQLFVYIFVSAVCCCL